MFHIKGIKQYVSFGFCFSSFGASMVTQTVKRLPVMQETQVRSLGWKDPLEKEMTTHSSILAWEIPRTEQPGGLYHGVSKELDTA